MKETRNLSGNCLIFERSRAETREGLSHSFVFFTLCPDEGQRFVCEWRELRYTSPHRQICQNCKCVRFDETCRHGGSWIETGREFRAASSKIYSRWTDEGRGMLASVDVKGNVRMEDGVNRGIERIVDPLRYGNFAGRTVISIRGPLDSRNSPTLFVFFARCHGDDTLLFIRIVRRLRFSS